MHQLTHNSMEYIDWLNDELSRGEYDDFFRHFSDVAGKRVLDVGCGPATLLAALSDGRSPTLMVALDTSAAWLHYVRNRFPNHADVAVLRASAEFLPFKTSSFDVVICSGVMPYVWDDARTIRELCHCISEEGMLFLRMHTAGNSICRILTRRGAEVHNMLSLLSSMFCQLTGRKRFLPSPDTHQSSWKIRRALESHNMEVIAQYKSKRWHRVCRLFDVIAKKAVSGPSDHMNAPGSRRPLSHDFAYGSKASSPHPQGNAKQRRHREVRQ